MFTVHTFDECRNNPELQKKYTGYKLCYIDDISKTINDYTEETKEIMAKPDFNWDEYGYGKPKSYMIRYKDYPNPEYIPNEQEYYAYFTPLSLDDQWGDDWNDSPYEYNAGIPYDNEWVIDESGKKTNREIVILMIPFIVKSYNFSFPKDWGGINSPFCIDDINHGACAWIYDCCVKTNMETHERTRAYVAIHGGDSVQEFEEKLNKIEKNNEGLWEPSADD